MRKTFIAVAISAVSIVAMSSSALAGEVTGSGKHKEVKGNSPCAFSGLDDQDPAEGGSGVVTPGEVQNWGHFKNTPFVVSSPRGARSVVVNFGGGDEAWGCNGNTFGQKDGPPAP